LPRLVLSILDKLLTQNVHLSSPDPFCQGVRAGWAVSRKFLFPEFASACKPHFATVEEKVDHVVKENQNK
jgi:gamma-glutamyl:cysteine ligase YbdK (ATP-grasp superfamily)